MFRIPMDIPYTVHTDLSESSNAMKSGPIPGYYLSNHHPHHPSQHVLTDMVSYSDSALIHSQPLFPPTSYHSSLHHNDLYGPSASYPVSSNSYWNHPPSSSSSAEFISPTGSSGSDSCLLVMPFDQHPPSSVSPTSTQSGSPENYIQGINYRISHSSGFPLINQHYPSIPFEHTIESDGTSLYNHHQMMQESLGHSQDPVTSSKKSLTTRRRNSPSKDMTVGQKPTKKERRRTVCINSAFSRLRERIPNVPVDTKLSKIKTLKLAKQYIEYLTEKLKEDPISAETSEASRFVGRPEEGFRADLTRYKRSRNSSHSVASSTCTSDASVGETRNMETTCFSMGLPRGRNRRVNNNKEAFTITTRNMIASQHKISLRARKNESMIDVSRVDTTPCSGYTTNLTPFGNESGQTSGRGRTGWPTDVWVHEFKADPSGLSSSLYHHYHVPNNATFDDHQTMTLRSHESFIPKRDWS